MTTSSFVRHIRGGVVLLALLFVGAAARGQTTQPTLQPPKVGDTAADFSLATPGGASVRLSELDKTGPVVLIELRGWVGYQCPFCTRQVADFIAHAKPLAAAGARVVLVYPGPADDLKQHAEDFVGAKQMPAGFFFVIDPDLTFVNAWGLRWNKPKETAYPSTFVIDSHGTIQFAKISHSHRDRGTAAEVLAVLAAKPS